VQSSLCDKKKFGSCVLLRDEAIIADISLSFSLAQSRKGCSQVHFPEKRFTATDARVQTERSTCVRAQLVQAFVLLLPQLQIQADRIANVMLMMWLQNRTGQASACSGEHNPKDGGRARSKQRFLMLCKTFAKTYKFGVHENICRSGGAYTCGEDIACCSFCGLYVHIQKKFRTGQLSGHDKVRRAAGLSQ